MGLSELQLKNKLYYYLDGAITLEQFCHWFMPASWGVKRPSESFRRLLYCTKIYVSEYQRGYWTKEELDDNLMELLTGQQHWPEVKDVLER
jgi:hypothetical protein